MVWRIEDVEPMQRDAGQNFALVRYLVIEYDVERRDAIRRNHEQTPVIHSEEFPYFARSQMLQLRHDPKDSAAPFETPLKEVPLAA